MRFKELERILLKDGWYLAYVSGSRHQYKHNFKSGKITIPRHNKELNIKTASSILKQAGLKECGTRR